MTVAAVPEIAWKSSSGLEIDAVAVLSKTLLPAETVSDSGTPVLTDAIESVAVTLLTFALPIELAFSSSLGAAVDFVAPRPISVGIELEIVDRDPADMTVVPATTVWMLVYVVWERAGQLVTVAAHEVIVTVRVVRIVEVYEPSSDIVAVVGSDPSASATGQTVVETTIVSVVTYVVLAVAGQLVTVDGHAVIVLVWVVKTVEVVN